MPSQHGGQPSALFVDRSMPDAAQFFGDLVDRCLASFTLRLSPQLKTLAVSLGSIDMRETKEVEGPGLSFATLPTVPWMYGANGLSAAPFGTLNCVGVTAAVFNCTV